MNKKQINAINNKRMFAREVAKEVFFKKITKDEETSSYELRNLFNITRQALRYYYSDEFFLKELNYLGVEMVENGFTGHSFKIDENKFMKNKGIESLIQVKGEGVN
ncbi:hypothetical protein [Fictibacillus fluitans]|uniref:Uncharacterized protein n=1 Tax=Fictibacillus fluitans TaxID=3058422 RepID=A0ABT8HQZ1_9BACL|nr:hypothetical protein [Fictibacillus sp. NE201]MDN4523177.1 hypothetical protein [Fictibacillus sp. NE201]